MTDQRDTRPATEQRGNDYFKKLRPQGEGTPHQNGNYDHATNRRQSTTHTVNKRRKSDIHRVNTDRRAYLLAVTVESDLKTLSSPSPCSAHNNTAQSRRKEQGLDTSGDRQEKHASNVEVPILNTRAQTRPNAKKQDVPEGRGEV